MHFAVSLYCFCLFLCSIFFKKKLLSPVNPAQRGLRQPEWVCGCQLTFGRDSGLNFCRASLVFGEHGTFLGGWKFNLIILTFKCYLTKRTAMRGEERKKGTCGRYSLFFSMILFGAFMGNSPVCNAEPEETYELRLGFLLLIKMCKLASNVSDLNINLADLRFSLVHQLVLSWDAVFP